MTCIAVVTGRGSSRAAAVGSAIGVCNISAVGSTISNPVTGAVYYVSATTNTPAGSDTTGTGSITRPWATFAKAISVMVAGDTTYVRGGTYRNRMWFTKSGAPNKYVTIKAYPGETVTIDGNLITEDIGSSGTWRGIIDFRGTASNVFEWITVSDIRVINAKSFGILGNAPWVANWTGSRGNIRVINCYSRQSPHSGIGFYNCINVTVTGCEVRRACDNDDQECISIAHCNGFEVSYCTVTEGGGNLQGGEGIDAKSGTSNGSIHHNTVSNLSRQGLYVDGWDATCNNISVYNNYVYNCQTNGMSVGAERGGLIQNISVYNNVFVGCQSSAIVISGYRDTLYSPPPGPPRFNNILIYNNTIYKNGWTGQWAYGIEVTANGVTNFQIRNNILSQNRSGQFSSNNNFDTVDRNKYILSHNLIDGANPSGWAGTNALFASPQFVAAASNNFHLLSTSPAKDSGYLSGSPATDFDGVSRGSVPSRGAYE